MTIYKKKVVSKNYDLHFGKKGDSSDLESISGNLDPLSFRGGGAGLSGRGYHRLRLQLPSSSNLHQCYLSLSHTYQMLE